jgi:SAM-dependent methyltransferase
MRRVVSALKRGGRRDARESAYRDEHEWWEEYFDRHGASAADPRRWRAAFPTGLYRRLRSDSESGATVTGVEIGSGPLSLLAWGVAEGFIDLKAVDPLAEAYQRLLARHGIAYPVAPVPGSGEALTELFEPDSFDFGFASNSLDHAEDPRGCLAQLATVVAPGGFLYAEGFVREGTNSAWQGVHQHDLILLDGALLRYDRRGAGTVITEGLGLECIDQTIVSFADRGLTTHGYEWSESHERDWRDDDWYTGVWRVTRAGRVP